MDHNENETNYATISIKTILGVFRKCWYWMVAGAIVIGIAIFGLYRLVYTPIYSSKSEFYLPNISENTYLYSSSQMAGAESMAETLTKLVKADQLIDEICKDLNQQYKASELRGMISASNDGAILYVTVSGEDAEKNYLVSQSMEKWLPVYCDYFNNQENALDPARESKTVKLVRTSSRDTVADNRSNLSRYPLLGGAISAIVVYLVFLIVELTNTTIYSSEDLKIKAPKYSVIGEISHWPLDGEKKGSKRKKMRRDEFRTNVDQKLLLREHVPFRISEAFHDLRTNITFCAAGEESCTIGVISSVAGSGKSFVMANLAVSLSKLYEKKVLLVDADMRCPMIHKIFSIPNKTGLSNLIVNQVEDDNAVKNSFGALDVITSGTLPPNPIDLLSCPRMSELVEQWKKTYDYVLIDLPPVGEVSDAFAVSGLISGYLVVLRSGYMDTRLLNDTIELVEDKNVKIYGYVVTDVHPEYADGYSYSKYGKYQAYHRYYSESQQAAQQQAENQE